MAWCLSLREGVLVTDQRGKFACAAAGGRAARGPVYNRATFSAHSDPHGEGCVPGTTESGFLTGIQQGEAESEAALYEKYSARVYYLALRESKSRQDAEDVRAETFLRVLQAIRKQQVRSQDALPAFILGVARNVLRELYARRRQMGDAVPAEEAELTTPSHEHNFIDRKSTRL